MFTTKTLTMTSLEILLVLLFLQYGATEKTEMLFKKYKVGYRIQNTFSRELARSVRECACRCLVTDGCLSFNTVQSANGMSACEFSGLEERNVIDTDARLDGDYTVYIQGIGT